MTLARVYRTCPDRLTADCTLLEIGDFPLNPMPGKEQKHNQLLMTRPAFGEIQSQQSLADNRPQMATVRPGVMQKMPSVADAPKPGSDRKKSTTQALHRIINTLRFLTFIKNAWLT